MKSRYVCTWSANVGDINRNKLRFGYSGMRFQIRVSIQGSGTRISGYPLRSLEHDPQIQAFIEDRMHQIETELLRMRLLRISNSIQGASMLLIV